MSERHPHTPAELVARLDGTAVKPAGGDDAYEPLSVQHVTPADDPSMAEWWWAHRDGRVSAGMGRAPGADITIELGPDAAMDVAGGRLSPSEALLYGSMRIRGDVARATRNVGLLDQVLELLGDA